MLRICCCLPLFSLHLVDDRTQESMQSLKSHNETPKAAKRNFYQPIKTKTNIIVHINHTRNTHVK